MEQLNFEIQYAQENADKQLYEIKDELLEPCMNNLFPRLNIEANRPDLVEITEQWWEMDLEETMWKCMSTVFFSKGVTVQQLLGIFWHQLDHIKIGQRRAKVMEPFFLSLTSSPYITMEKKGVEFIYYSKLEVNLEEYGYILPSLDMPIVESNRNIGYKSLKEHIITGHKLKQHDKEVCLDHINRMNAICYRVETRMLALYKPTFNPEPKMKKDTGKYETTLEVQKRKESFQYYADSLPEKIRIMVQNGNKFHICHRYDNRLRTYAKAHHFDYIGQKYSRALVQPVISELTEGTNEYL